MGRADWAVSITRWCLMAHYIMNIAMNNGQSISHLWHYFPSLPMGLEEEYRDLRQPAAFSLYLDQMVSPGHKELNPKSASISTSAKRPHFPSSFQAVLKSWLIFPKHEKNSNITESRSWDRWNRWCLHQCVSQCRVDCYTVPAWRQKDCQWVVRHGWCCWLYDCLIQIQCWELF